MCEFIASKSLSPEDFAHFKSQVANDMAVYHRRLVEARKQRKEAHEFAQNLSRHINEMKAYCLRHGIDPNDL